MIELASVRNAFMNNALGEDALFIWCKHLFRKETQRIDHYMTIGWDILQSLEI
jgi:hypothetical protein